MKSKFGRRLYKLNKPSAKEINNEQQMNEEQKACDRLRQQSLFQFEENDTQDDNPYLNRNFRFHKIKTQIKQRSQQHKYQNSSSLQKAYVKPHMRALPIVSMQQRISQCSKSVSTSPRRKLPLNLTQYMIMDTQKSEDGTLVKKSINFLKQKYIKALSYPIKRNQTPKKSPLYFNFSSTSTKMKILNINQDQKKKKH